MNVIKDLYFGSIRPVDKAFKKNTEYSEKVNQQLQQSIKTNTHILFTIMSAIRLGAVHFTGYIVLWIAIETYSKLADTITDEQKSLLDSLVETLDSMTEIIAAEAFCDGFRLGAEMMLEVKDESPDSVFRPIV